MPVSKKHFQHWMFTVKSQPEDRPRPFFDYLSVTYEYNDVIGIKLKQRCFFLIKKKPKSVNCFISVLKCCFTSVTQKIDFKH